MPGNSTPFLPQPIYSVEDGPGKNIPRVFISPQRYVQGPGVLDHLGRYLTLVPGRRAAIVASRGGFQRHGGRISSSLRENGFTTVSATFGGECSIEEIERIVAELEAGDPAADIVIAAGGGKCIDTGKCVAHRLGVPLVIVPTLASNDAPCSAISVIYTPEGSTAGAEFFPESPALVVMDTAIVAEAPVRYLVAGIGDAMATWYEARTCSRNPSGRTILGARPTLAALALAEGCIRILLEDSEAAIAAVDAGKVNDALERIVEVNTLLSGIGFESGGLAGAHSVAQGFPFLPNVHAGHLHGEMVAMGLLTQLVMEGHDDEAVQVAEFFARVGLPVHLGQLSIADVDPAALNAVVDVALSMFILANEPFPVTREMLLEALGNADALGRKVAESKGDVAYRRLQGKS